MGLWRLPHSEHVASRQRRKRLSNIAILEPSVMDVLRKLITAAVQGRVTETLTSDHYSIPTRNGSHLNYKITNNYIHKYVHKWTLSKANGKLL